MPKIPLMIPPAPGELMISYLWRLAKHNELRHVSDLLQAYVWPNNDLRPYQKQPVRIDCNNVFRDFYKAADLPIDPVRFYLDHTIYTGLVPITDGGFQMSVIAHAFHNDGEMQLLNYQPNNLFDTLHICPLCQKEDKEKFGFWYYHREHHMPGVKMCFQHKRPLVDQKTRRKDNKSVAFTLFADNVQYNDIPIMHEGWEQKYAYLSKELLDSELDTNLDKIENTSRVKNHPAFCAPILSCGVPIPVIAIMRRCHKTRRNVPVPPVVIPVIKLI